MHTSALGVMTQGTHVYFTPTWKDANKNMLPETAHKDAAREDDNRMTEAVLEVNDADFICVLAEAARNRAAQRIRALGIALAAYCLALMLQHGRGFFR